MDSRSSPGSAVPGLTIFSTPKPFRGHIGEIQRNALRSWTRLDLDCQILLFGDEEGAGELCQELGLTHVPNIQRNEYGTPLLDALFAQARHLARHSLLCYANADIIFMQDFADAIQQVRRLRSPFLMVGRRVDLDVTQVLEFEPKWDAALRQRMALQGKLHGPAGLDYFVFRPDTWKTVPPFAIGRFIWDNWLLYGAQVSGATLIDASPSVSALHQNHDYGHFRGGVKEMWAGPEATRNRELASGLPEPYSSENASWLLTRWGLVPAWTFRHLRKRVTSRIRAKPRVRALLRSVRRVLRGGFSSGSVAGASHSGNSKQGTSR